MKSNLLFAASIVMAAALYVAPVKAQEKREKQQRISVFTSVSPGSLSEGTVMEYSEDGHDYKVKLNDTKIIEIYRDGTKVPEAEFSKYEPSIKKILEQLEKDRKQAELDRAQAAKDRARAEQDRELAEKHREQANRDRERAEVDRKEADVRRGEAAKDRERADRDRVLAEKDRAQATIAREHAEKDREQANRDRKQAEVDRKLAEEDRAMVEQLLEDLVAEKLIEDKDALKSLQLNDSELSINGVKQSDALHSKLKTKYLKGRHKKINFTRSGEFRGISVQ
ncbi:MAG: hypothetical protein EOP48_05710 [Sphingobacteriales bacterium]|nr:MAG: hypothetical protein EOP48_05710 [Sphingobacteriales bacterium]